MAKAQLFSGARGQIKIGNKTLAYATDISVSTPVSVRGVHTFGSLNARSVEPLQVGVVSVTIGRVIPVNLPDGTKVNSSNISEGIEPTIASMIAADDITVQLVDKTTGQTVANIVGCRWAGRSLSTSAGQLAQERINLMGLYDSGPNNENLASTGIA